MENRLFLVNVFITLASCTFTCLFTLSLGQNDGSGQGYKTEYTLELNGDSAHLRTPEGKPVYSGPLGDCGKLGDAILDDNL